MKVLFDANRESHVIVLTDQELDDFCYQFKEAANGEIYDQEQFSLWHKKISNELDDYFWEKQVDKLKKENKELISAIKILRGMGD